VTTGSRPLLAVALLMLGAAAVAAQEPRNPENYLLTETVPRFALAVGVENYDFFDRVPNALNDMEVAVTALKRAGFETVISEPDPTTERLYLAINRLAKMAVETQRPSVVAIYFAGHGFQEGTDNFIVPKDAKPATLLDDSIPVPNIISKFARRSESAGVSFLFLDACRTLTPLVQPSRPGGRPIPVAPGFGQAANFPGAIQIFAAMHGEAALSQAFEGDVNSPYSQALQQNLNTPGDNIAATYSKVRNFVSARVNQHPEMHTVASVATIRFMPLATSSEFEAEERHWRATLESNRLECVNEFIQAFPDSRYVVAALRWKAENSSRPTPGGNTCPQRQ